MKNKKSILYFYLQAFLVDIFGRPKSFQGDADNDSEVINGTFINDFTHGRG